MENEESAVDELARAIVTLANRIEQHKRDCFVETARRDGLENICRLVGIELPRSKQR